MKALKKTWVAYTCALLLALCSIFGLGGIKLASVRKEAVTAFFQGQNGFSAYHDLAKRRESSYNLIHIGEKVLPGDNQQLKQCKSSWERFKEGNKPEDYASANPKLQSSVEQLYEVILQQSSLSDKERERADRQYSDFNERMSNLKYDDYYNGMAESYNKLCSKFPANLIANVTGNRQLPTFSGGTTE